jgi:hypothetical protein
MSIADNNFLKTEEISVFFHRFIALIRPIVRCLHKPDIFFPQDLVTPTMFYSCRQSS